MAGNPLLANERQFQSQVIDAAHYMGWKVIHVHRSRNSDGSWTTPTTMRGWPDLSLIRPPRLIFAEIKGPKTPLRPEQAAILDLLNACDGVEAYVWRSGVHDLASEIVPILRRSATLPLMDTRTHAEDR